MQRFLRFVAGEMAGWSLCEIIWLAFATASILSLSAYWGDTWYGMTSAATGVICVILTGKGKLSAYAFGVVNCVLYAYVSYGQSLYGEVMLNALWYLPLQFYGFRAWKRNMVGTEVKRQSMRWLKRAENAMWISAVTLCYGGILAAMGDPLPFVDSFTTVASVFAMWLSCRRYSEQWYLWIAVDVLSVYMWWNRYAAGGDNVATLLMWCVFLVNAVYGCVKWETNAESEVAE